MKIFKNKLILIIIAICIVAITLYVLALPEEVNDVDIAISDEVHVVNEVAQSEGLQTSEEEEIENKPGTIRKLENVPLQVAYNSVGFQGGDEEVHRGSNMVILEAVEDDVIRLSYGTPYGQDEGGVQGQNLYIFKKNPDKSMEEILEGHLDGENPEMCLPVIKEKSEFSDTAYIYQFTWPVFPEIEKKYTEREKALDYLTDYWTKIEQICGKDAQNIQQYFYDSREGLSDYYFKYSTSWYDVRYLYDKDMNKVKWHETIEPVE